MLNNSLQELAEIFADNNDPGFIYEFLEQLLTKNEVKELGQRWELVKLIYQGVPQREIARKLGISLCKITRGAKELKKNNNAFEKILEKKGK